MSQSRSSSLLTPRQRWGVASRTMAAIVGGYALAAFSTTALALALPTPREEAAMLATLPSFLIYAGAIIWAFAARTALRAWVGILAPLLLTAALTWWLHGRPAP